MADKKLVKDVMEPAVELKASDKAGDALRKLEQAQALFGVVIDTQGQTFAAIKPEHLRKADPDKLLDTLMGDAQPLVTVEPDATLDSILQQHQIDLIQGISSNNFLVKEQNNLIGIMAVGYGGPAASPAGSGAESQVNLGRLEGTPITPPLLYRCPRGSQQDWDEGKEQKWVASFDPNLKCLEHDVLMLPLLFKILPVFKNRVLSYHLITENDIDMMAFNWDDDPIRLDVLKNLLGVKKADRHTYSELVQRLKDMLHEDGVMKEVNWNGGSPDTVSDKSDLTGHYTLGAIDAKKPIKKSQIGPKLDIASQMSLTDKIVTAIPADGRTTLGGTVRAGDRVRVSAVPLPDKTSGHAGAGQADAGNPVADFNEVLVLDVKTVGNQTVIILAIPSQSWLNYLTKTRNATVVLSYPIVVN